MKKKWKLTQYIIDFTRRKMTYPEGGKSLDVDTNLVQKRNEMRWIPLWYSNRNKKCQTLMKMYHHDEVV